MNILLEQLTERDAEKLFAFEGDNRSFFEKMVPGRGESYYQYDEFLLRHQALLLEQEKKEGYYYLVKNPQGTILGRMNIGDVDASHQSGFLGYRIGESFAGKGIAKKSLAILLQLMQKEPIQQIAAKTTTNNIASQKVLEKNGFEWISQDKEHFEMNGELCQFVHYQWTKHCN
ncbi:GNAT family N-acetyltransferase [Alkalicoccus daliensis]|uniref:Ribosomal-protein-alanine N-acetyltransferase n=1 Tax=Alkalicoccus daliensis TaxID=745820 RepID=A0A1H0CR97_9BACI|nr:GNAT family protein [Alkalicoccus daliensis]SDN60400.1 ribosomal-protein-alanine N-acetyltransferase [Alkalicoccus daliensis]